MKSLTPGRDDRRPDGLLSKPVGGVEVWINQRAETRRQFDREVPREAVHLGQQSGMREHVQHVVERPHGPRSSVSVRRVHVEKAA